MPKSFQVGRCADISRADEIHAFTQTIFGALEIDPPSGVLEESEADFAARLARETCFIVEAEGKLIASAFCAAGRRCALRWPAGGASGVAPPWRRQCAHGGRRRLKPAASARSA